MDEPPVRLCCMSRHWGVQCPDGKVMCASCFGRFEMHELAIDPEDGKYWDVCKMCDDQDRLLVRCRDFLASMHNKIMGDYDGDPTEEHPYQDAGKTWFWNSYAYELAQFVKENNG